MLFKPCFALVFDMFAFPAALCWCALALWFKGYLLILGPIVVLFSLHFDWSRARLGLPVIHYVNSAFDKRMPVMFNFLRILPDVVKCIVIYSIFHSKTIVCSFMYQLTIAIMFCEC